MKGSTLRRIIVGTLLAFVLAIAPSMAQPVVSCQTATLPERDPGPTGLSSDDIDTFVVFNWFMYADAILHQITVDTYPTFEAGLCTTYTPGNPDVSNGTGPSDGDPDYCDDTSVDVDELRIGDSNFRPGSGGNDFGSELAVRSILGDDTPTYWSGRDIPIQRATNLALVLSNDEMINDIKVKVCAAFTTTRTPRATVTIEGGP